MPLIQTATFEFTQRSGRAHRFNATTELGAYPTVFRAVADEGDTSLGILPGPGEMVTIGTGQTPCGPEPDWTMYLQTFEGRAVAGRRLQANHAYPIVSDAATPEEFSKLRIRGGKGAGEFIAQSGSIIVDSVDDRTIVLRLKDIVFVHVDGDGKPDGGGLFLLNGTISMESNST